MAKKKSAKQKGGAQQRRRTRHLSSVPSEPADDSPHSQELIRGLRQALRSDHPMDLLLAVSGIMTAADPRIRNPFEPDDNHHVTLEELVDSFVGVDIAETTAALHVLRVLIAHELLSARITKVLRGRRQPMPLWLDDLDARPIDRLVEMSHILGDGDDYFLETRFRSGDVMTALVYVDHNLGTVVKDAFLIPEPVDTVMAVVNEQNDDPDTTFTEPDHAQARATISEAIEHGARMFPPVETDSWPQCRPVVEWLLRSLPVGGVADPRPVWSEKQVAGLREEFLASPYGTGMGGADERDLLEHITWFGTDWGPGDPLRWSPVNVEMLLADWFPRKIVADVEYLTKAPDVLRRFIEFCHHRQGIRPSLTAEVQASVDQWEPEFQRLIRTSRPQGADALLTAMFEAREDFRGSRSLTERLLDRLDDAVGGRDALLRLDASPLPDEPFEWRGIPEDIRGRVQEVLDLCDRCAMDLLDVEHRTAFRRFLGRSAAGDPSIFRRKGSPARAAAAVCWAVAKANESIVYIGSRLESQELIGWFGVKGSVSQRAEVFLKAIGVNPYHQYGEMALGSPDYLVSERRAGIAAARDECLKAED